MDKSKEQKLLELQEKMRQAQADLDLKIMQLIAKHKAAEADEK